MAKRILIVEDDHYLVEIYRRVLLAEGYEVACAYNGKEGVNLMRANKQPDLIVLDLKMPKMTGDEFIKAVRRENLLKKGTRVLVLSSVLYRYKPIPRYENLAGSFGGHSYMKEDGFTKIGERADEAQPTEMQEKPEHLAKMFGLGNGRRAESQAEFEEKVRQDLIKRVKTMFGEAYVEKKRHVGLVPPSPKTIIPARVIELVAEYLKVDKEKLSIATDFDKDLKVAFMQLLRLRRRINTEFGIKISFWIQRDIETVGDLIHAVEYTKQLNAYERKRQNRKLKQDLKPFVFLWIILALIGLGMLIWEFVIKVYFIK